MISSTPTHPLKQPSFFWFWLGQTITILGDRVYSVALPFLLFELGGDAGQLGQLLATYMVPQALFLLVGGVLVDRLPRRLTMQELVPGEVLGRVVSIDMLGSFALLPLGFLLTGYLVESFDVGRVALWCGGATVVLALVGLLAPAVRQLD